MLESTGILSCVAEKGPCCRCLIPCPAFALSILGRCTLFWCCRVTGPCLPLLSLLFRSSRKASLTPCQLQALLPSTDQTVLSFLLLAWEPLGKGLGPACPWAFRIHHCSAEGSVGRAYGGAMREACILAWLFPLHSLRC